MIFLNPNGAEDIFKTPDGVEQCSDEYKNDPTVDMCESPIKKLDLVSTLSIVWLSYFTRSQANFIVQVLMIQKILVMQAMNKQ